MNTLESYEIVMITSELITATDELCAHIHNMQCDVVTNTKLTSKAKVETVLQMQRLLVGIERLGSNQINSCNRL